MAQAATVAQPLRWPIVPILGNRDATLPLSQTVGKDARLINCYAEKDPLTGQYNIEKRPALSQHTAIPQTQQGYGTYAWITSGHSPAGPTGSLGISLVRAGTSSANLTLCDDNGLNHSTLSGAISTGTAHQQMATFQPIPTATPALFIHCGGNGYTISGSYAVTTLAGGFPGAGAANLVPGAAYLDGTTYVMDVLGNIWGSNINDITTWNALNVEPANQIAGVGMGLAQQLVYVLAFMSTSIQVFYDAQNPAPGSPLSALQGGIIPYGCQDGQTIAQIDGTILFVTNGLQGTAQVARIDNLQLSIVSTPNVDRLLSTATSTDIWLSNAFKMGGHRFYCVSNLTKNYTLVYDIDQQLWYIWTDPSGNALLWTQAAYLGNNTIIQNYSIGVCYNLAPDFVTPTDLGVIVPVDIYTQSYDADTQRKKTLSKMWFNGDQVAGSLLEIQWSDNDYQSWSPYREVDLSLDGPELTDCGTFKKRALHMHHARATPFRLKNIDLQLDIGTL